MKFAIPSMFDETSLSVGGGGLSAFGKSAREGCSRVIPLARRLTFGVFFLLAALSAHSQSINLLERYPTKLVEGDAAPDRARPWKFSEADLYAVSKFIFQAAELRIECGPADVGIGHCTDGALWAVVLPRENGRLTSPATGQPEPIAHIWLRFHPKEIRRIFPDDTVSASAATDLMPQITIIAGAKFTSSWHAGLNAMIPQPKDLTVDVDTKQGRRRFFVVDREMPRAEYVPAFERRSVKPAPPITLELAADAFDQLWNAFDRDYAMFVLRPEVDWVELREQYRPKALAAGSAYEFAAVCADMLRLLRDLHVWLKLAGADVPVFNRPRAANANPSAARAIVGDIYEVGPGVRWGITADNIGYLVIDAWNDQDLPARCDHALEQMRESRALVVDVRLNGGGSEDLAGEVAGRFLPVDFVYAYSQFRNGPGHTDLTAKIERTVRPRGPWRYHRPVVLLIGQKCMSSNESFVAMMSGDPDLVTMGDHTCGSSGNPRMVELALKMSVSVPRWIDYLPDGTALDERGFQPQVRFEPGPGAFDGHRDDLLSAALARLRQNPTSEKPVGRSGSSNQPKAKEF